MMKKIITVYVDNQLIGIELRFNGVWKMKFIKNWELDDTKIVTVLRKAADDYENGELIEVRDTLLEIIDAIDKFTYRN